MNYISQRFQKGYDEELQHHLLNFSDSSHAARLKEDGQEVLEILGRRPQGNTFMYEVRWKKGDDENEKSWEPVTKLRKMGLNNLILACDERSVANLRPLTRREIVKHCEAFGFDAASCCEKKLGSFSPNSLILACLAVVFWTKPHFIMLEELSANMDAETLEGLEVALQNFKGGALVLDSNREFAQKVCNQSWNLEGRSLTVADVAKA